MNFTWLADALIGLAIIVVILMVIVCAIIAMVLMSH